MHKQLEDYLAEVARQIGSIPKPRRDEELKEMRAHLVHAVAANGELGQSEDVAVANALHDFGTPAEAALNVVKAWRCFTWKHGVKTFWNMLGIQSAFYAFHDLVHVPEGIRRSHLVPVAGPLPSWCAFCASSVPIIWHRSRTIGG